MSKNLPVRHGGQIVVDALRRHGVEVVFCVPGESFLGILDALLDAPEIRLVTCRHESGAAYMAEAYRSEEHTSELQSLMRISYAVLCLKKKKQMQSHDHPE